TADIAASPLARRMAAQSGIDLGSVVGSGAHGKIVKADIEAALGIASEEGSVASSAAMAATPNRGAYAPSPAKREAIATRTISPRSYPDSGPTPFEDETPSRTRRVIADRLTAAKRDIPHFYLSADVDVARLVSLRAELKAKRPELGLTLNDFCVRALALALARVPDANVAWIDNKLRRWQRVDVAVAVEGPAGLITPVVAGADRLSLSDLSAAVSELARRARANDLKPHEYSGGSATISNLGMHGVSSLYPILNPPQSVIIGVGAAEDRAVVRDGVIEPGRVMTLTLAGDHRALDGATGARLLAAIRELIEDPLSLLV
ncbi:MAG: pyruvate dehydrogenase E2 component (dihydrolipoamide acetyltransferase), partial [Hyphomicrobiaceae bacterium]